MNLFFERRIASLVSELLPERVSPELPHLQVKLAAQLSYRQAAAFLGELLPETGGLIMPRQGSGLIGMQSNAEFGRRMVKASDAKPAQTSRQKRRPTTVFSM
jgi:hypothetical protein